MHRTAIIRILRSANARKLICANVYPSIGCQLGTTTARKTDGVYKALTAMRVRIPWIEALTKQREQDNRPAKQSIAPPESPDRDLLPKKMSDSFHKVIIPLAQDPWLLDNYLNANGRIRLGTIFMDLDALAGVIAYKHTGDFVTTVTAAVDRITISHPLEDICDLELSGQVTFATGRSSMEVSLQVAKASKTGETPKKEDVLMTCAFTMVSLDPTSKKPVSISPLRVETEEEKQLFDLGEKNYNAKKALAKINLRKQTPNDIESDLIHDMWLKQLEYHDPNIPTRKPDNTVYMDLTRMHTTHIMQPQYRNRHNFMIFGGFLLKQTFELAFCCAAAFSHSRPTFLSLDPSTFANPVPVGSVLYLTATVAYTDQDSVVVSDSPSSTNTSASTGTNSKNYSRVQIRIDSKVRNIEHREMKPTGQFHYTFLVETNIQVMPRTYSEFMIWVDARRRAEGISPSIEKDMRNDGGAAQALEGRKRNSIIE